MVIVHRFLKNTVIKKSIAAILTCFFKLSGKNYIIVHMDGGICSQMHFYLVGSYFAEKGYSVKYDTRWFLANGKDFNGKDVRNFDIKKLEPNINLEECNSSLMLLLYIYFLSSNYRNHNDINNECNWRNDIPPVYMGEYYKDYPEMFTQILPKYFKLTELILCLDAENKKVLEKIQEGTSVAVHVRRGDLTSYTKAYGNPCSIDYFEKAIHVFDSQNATFYFFSDGPEWCKEELIPKLPQGNKYIVVDINGSDKGYMDLVLMAACTHTITSKGSLGKYSACINNHPDRIVVLNDDTMEQGWKDVFTNSIYIKN